MPRALTLSILALFSAACGAAEESSAPYHGKVVDLLDYPSCPAAELGGEVVVPGGVFPMYTGFPFVSEIEDTVFVGPPAFWTRGGMAPAPLGTEDQESLPVGPWLVSQRDWTYGQLAAGGSFTQMGTLPLGDEIVAGLDPMQGRIYVSPRDAGSVSRVDLATGSVAWSTVVPLSYFVLILTTDGQQVFGVSTEPALYALDTETGAAIREELPPRTFHQVLAIQGDWRLLYTESEMGSFIEWWQPSTSTTMPVATNLDRICSVCASYAFSFHDQLFISNSGSLFSIDSAGRCRWYAGGNGPARGSRTRGSTTTLEAYWQNNSGILRL